MAMRGLRKALLAGVYWFFELLSELQGKNGFSPERIIGKLRVVEI